MSNRLRFFGFNVDRGDELDLNQQFESLAEAADEASVQWRDLVADGYRVRGDRVVGGIQVRYDWQWRIEELERRLEEAGGRPAR